MYLNIYFSYRPRPEEANPQRLGPGFNQASLLSYRDLKNPEYL